MRNGLDVAAEIAPTALLRILASSEKKESHRGVLCVLFSIARAYPQCVASAAAVCAKLTTDAIDKNNTTDFNFERSAFNGFDFLPRSGDMLRVLSATAGVSAKARSTIASTVQRMYVA